MRSVFTFIIAVLILTACSAQPTVPTMVEPTVTIPPSPTLIPTPFFTETPIPTPIPSTPDISHEPPEGGWNSVIADGLAIYPDGQAWVDADGVQHFKFDQGDKATNGQKIADLEKMCMYSKCIHYTDNYIQLEGRFRGEKEILIDKDGMMELVTKIDLLNNLREGELQEMTIRFLLPERDSVNFEYYQNMGLPPEINKLNMATILKIFKVGGQFSKPIIYITYNPSESILNKPRWKKYRYSDDYLVKLQSWKDSNFDPKKDMEIIGY